MAEEIRPEGALAALGDAVPPPEIVFNGRPWRIGHPTQLAKAELEKLVVEVSEQALADVRGSVKPARYAALEKRLDDAILARQWQTWGSLWNEVVDGPLSFPLFLLSLMRPHHPTATVADAQALWLGENRKVRTALVMVLPGFFELLAATLPGGADERAATVQQVIARILASLAPETPSGSTSTTP